MALLGDIIFTNDGSEQEDAHLLSQAVLALGILEEIPKHNGKKRKLTCIIATIFLISLQ